MRSTESKREKLALVLSGGGLRSAAQIGVLKVLARYGIKPDCVVGTSGGAVVAALYASGLTPAEIEERYLAIIGKEGRFIDIALGRLWKALIKLDLTEVKGLVKGAKLRRYIHKNLRYLKHFQDYRTLSPKQAEQVLDLYLTAVDINDGTEVVFAPGKGQLIAGYGPGFSGFRLISDISVADAVRCSIGIPGVFEPYRYKGHYYVDGGLRDNLPLGVAVKLAGADRVIAVDLGYAGLRQENLVDNGVIDILGQSVDIMSMDQLAADLQDNVVREKPIVILNPLIYDIGILDTQYIPAIIKRGEFLAETYCHSKGLEADFSPQKNSALFFTGVNQPVLYPAKESSVYVVLRKQITAGAGDAGKEEQVGWWQRLEGSIEGLWRKVMVGLSLCFVGLGLFLVWSEPAVIQGLGLFFVFAGLVTLYYQHVKSRNYRINS
ncbi:MAG: patatin-like phospholipase family protein [Firmicutes bacterium]|nr:patatin-like phospholipase family protein [Bacillota bacterium]